MATLLETEPTPEQLLAVADTNGWELIDGQLVEKPMGMESAVVEATVLALLGAHVKGKSLGFVIGSECGYQIFSDQPNKVRKPDGSFIACGRLPDDKPVRGHVKIAPDLAFEVISPNDLAEEVNGKVVAFLQAGVRLLWVLYPETRTVHVFRPKRGTTLLTAEDELSGEDVLPGFLCKVSELFVNL